MKEDLFRELGTRMIKEILTFVVTLVFISCNENLFENEFTISEMKMVEECKK